MSSSTSSPKTSPWSDSLGRAAIRGLQLLVLVAVVALLIYGLLAVKVVVMALLVALILASAVRPVVAWLERRSWPGWASALLVFVGLILLLGSVTTGVVFGIRDGWSNLMSSATSGWHQLQSWIHDGPLPIPVDANTVNSALSQLQSALTSTQAEQSAIAGLSVASEVVAGTILMIVALFFFIKDGPGMWAFALSWIHGPSKDKFDASGQQTVKTLGGYTRGIALIATVDALLIGVGLWILQIPLVIPLTVIIFVTAFIPIVGALLAGTLAALVALVASGPVAALIVVAIVVVVHHIDGYILHPLIMGKTLHLHGLVILLAVAAGTLLGGVAGAILAVPITAVAWAVVKIWTARDAGPAPTPAVVTANDDDGAPGPLTAPDDQTAVPQ
ncbi:AI-2E family transporter [Kocuria sp.]|uniref:AI-2E family transporter n=1 Tax=Kocuria sp. TaxID=1871328 RepID=UPI0026E0A8D2|nr:AI-2E family transporter [Kocuria sp.]MDO5618076.1 AI-2E family transporter [Kocuria sp.]